MVQPQDQGVSSPEILRVSVDNLTGPPEEYEFCQSFRIGRADECDICIDNRYVSRRHVEVSCVGGEWQVRDLQSSNGIFVSGRSVPLLRLTGTDTVRLGIGGPFLSF